MLLLCNDAIVWHSVCLPASCSFSSFIEADRQRVQLEPWCSANWRPQLISIGPRFFRACDSPHDICDAAALATDASLAMSAIVVAYAEEKEIVLVLQAKIQRVKLVDI